MSVTGDAGLRRRAFCLGAVIAGPTVGSSAGRRHRPNTLAYVQSEPTNLAGNRWCRWCLQRYPENEAQISVEHRRLAQKQQSVFSTGNTKPLDKHFLKPQASNRRRQNFTEGAQLQQEAALRTSEHRCGQSLSSSKVVHSSLALWTEGNTKFSKTAYRLALRHTSVSNLICS